MFKRPARLSLGHLDKTKMLFSMTNETRRHVFSPINVKEGSLIPRLKTAHFKHNRFIQLAVTLYILPLLLLLCQLKE